MISQELWKFLSEKKSDIEAKVSEEGECFGLVSRVPNPFNDQANVIMVTGSRREGQVLLTKWIKDCRNEIMQENEKYANNKPFQIFISGKFNADGKINNIGSNSNSINKIKDPEFNREKRTSDMNGKSMSKT